MVKALFSTHARTHAHQHRGLAGTRNDRTGGLSPPQRPRHRPPSTESLPLPDQYQYSDTYRVPHGHCGSPNQTTAGRHSWQFWCHFGLSGERGNDYSLLFVYRVFHVGQGNFLSIARDSNDANEHNIVVPSFPRPLESGTSKYKISPESGGTTGCAGCSPVVPSFPRILSRSPESFPQLKSPGIWSKTIPGHRSDRGFPANRRARVCQFGLGGAGTVTFAGGPLRES